MQKRYDRIAEDDEIKKKVAEIRKKMFENQGKKSFYDLAMDL